VPLVEVEVGLVDVQPLAGRRSQVKPLRVVSAAPAGRVVVRRDAHPRRAIAVAAVFDRRRDTVALDVVACEDGAEEPKVHLLGEVVQIAAQLCGDGRGEQAVHHQPAVLARNGAYVLYYTARYAMAGVQCISPAVSATPAGPYVDDST